MFKFNIKDIRTTKDILFVNWIGDKHTGLNMSICLQILLKSFGQQENFSLNYLQPKCLIHHATSQKSYKYL